MARHKGKPILTLNLLGVPEVLLGDKPLSLGTAKAKALLFYLVVTGQPHSRAMLVDLLWGEMAEAKARRNLTTTLTNLRKKLSPFLEVEPDRIAFRQDSHYQLDVDQFEEQLAQGESTQEMRLVREAVALYRGEFLEGLSVKDAHVFEEWVFTESEGLREQLLQALQNLVDDAVHHGDYASGLDYAHQLLTMDPWRETAHRQLMILHAQNGRRDAALTQYETCRKILAEELGVDPLPETMALHMRLLEADTTPPHNLPPPPNSFVGRTTERQQIAQQLDNPECRLLTVVGPGGVGKTRLAVEAARRYTDSATSFTSNHFGDGIYFVSVVGLADGVSTSDSSSGGINNGRNRAAKQSSSVVHALITAIAEAVGYTFAGSTPPQDQLFSALRSRSLLLLCDNFEALLQPNIGQTVLDFLSSLLREIPNVKLLVTSRARLRLVEEWVLSIEGLDYPTTAQLISL
ncbi:AAA family ATPase [Chloroflexi bacterium TSY]|nr:AAA family ATPase [Chloroflexi bacterium TSY]